jgi:single-stranded DNA-binding protein
MVSFMVRCWRERIRTIAFKDLAASTTLAAGDRVEVQGHIQSTEWQDQGGNKRSGWQVIADEIHIADDTDSRQQEQSRPPARQEAHQPDLFPAKRLDTCEQHQYQGGPF